jgi:hypothetical protein
MSQSLTILGGQPVRTRPFTSWPIFGESEEQRLLHPRSVNYKQRRQKANSYQCCSCGSDFCGLTVIVRMACE